jgi:hypothetical protein
MWVQDKGWAKGERLKPRGGRCKGKGKGGSINPTISQFQDGAVYWPFKHKNYQLLNILLNILSKFTQDFEQFSTLYHQTHVEPKNMQMIALQWNGSHILLVNTADRC